jgi:phospholipid transport system substrate-binding protein
MLSVWKRVCAERIWALTFLVVAGLCGQAAAANPPASQQAENFIAQVADEAFAIMRDPALDVEARKTAIRSIVDRDMAVDYIAKLSLGHHGKPRSEWDAAQRQRFDQQMDEYLTLFPDFTFNKLYDLVISKFTNATVEVVGSVPVKDTDTIVQTKIIRPGSAEPILAEWRVRADKSGDLKVIDVKAEGISLILTQRDEFSSIIGNGGLDRLLEHMRQQTATPAAADAPADGNS